MHPTSNQHVKSLFTNIPVKDDYVLKRIYKDKVIKLMCKKSMFKKLLIKLTKEGVFSVNLCSIKQIDDGCPMGAPISVAFSEFICVK